MLGSEFSGSGWDRRLNIEVRAGREDLSSDRKAGESRSKGKDGSMNI